MAEGKGFEPLRRLPAYTLSRRAPSTTRPPLLEEKCAERPQLYRSGFPVKQSRDAGYGADRRLGDDATPIPVKASSGTFGNKASQITLPRLQLVPICCAISAQPATSRYGLREGDRDAEPISDFRLLGDASGAIRRAGRCRYCRERGRQRFDRRAVHRWLD